MLEIRRFVRTDLTKLDQGKVERLKCRCGGERCHGCYSSQRAGKERRWPKHMRKYPGAGPLGDARPDHIHTVLYDPVIGVTGALAGATCQPRRGGRVRSPDPYGLTVGSLLL
jgi:hypothetical protein